jgi:3-hydroxyacyl-CoA dehydrogenase
VVATAFELAKKMKKVPVRAGVCDGFIGNRILAVYKQAADYLMEDGASPYEIDEAVRDFGFAMGPFQVTDLAGGDIGWATRKRRAATRDPRPATWRLPTASASAAGSARRPDAASTSIPKGARIGTPDPEVLAIVDAERARGHHAAQLQQRGDHAPLHGRHGQRGRQRGARGHCAAPAGCGRDLPVRLRLSAPPRRPHEVGRHGGPAQGAGRHRAFAKEDPLFWKPSPLLVELVERGASFESLNQAG